MGLLWRLNKKVNVDSVETPKMLVHLKNFIIWQSLKISRYEIKANYINIYTHTHIHTYSEDQTLLAIQSFRLY